MAKKPDGTAAGSGLPDVLIPAGETGPTTQASAPAETEPADSAAPQAEAAPREADTGGAVRKRGFRVPAPDCPVCKSGARVYKTLADARYCICDACGHQFKQVVDLESQDPVLYAAAELCEDLGRCEPIPDPKHPGEFGILIPVDVATAFRNEIAKHITLKPRKRLA